MFRATHALVSLFAVTTIATLSAACDDDTTAKPQVIFSGNTQEPTSNGTGVRCGDTGDLFAVGAFGNADAKPPEPSVAVSDNSPSGQGTASVACSVKSTGTDEFAVYATIAQSGATGGLFQIDGTFKTTGEQTNIHVLASKRFSANQFEEQDRACVVAAYVGNEGVAAGRVWGEVTCPNAVVTGGDGTRACEIKAQFRFENCSQ